MAMAQPSVGEAAEGIRWPRVVLLVPLAWWTLTLGTGKSAWCFLDLVNLAFHEAGHLFLSFAGSTLHYLGGTIGQLLVPTLLAVRFLFRERQAFAAAICFWWVGENFINISVYMADARELALPLVGGGDHDWNELFFRFGLLGADSVNRVAGATHVLGAVTMVLGLGWAGFFALPGDVRVRIRRALTSRWPWLESALVS